MRRRIPLCFLWYEPASCGDTLLDATCCLRLSLQSLHARSIRTRIAALAMCRKFHVTKYSTPFVTAMAMCAASAAASRGTAPGSSRRRARSSASGDASTRATPSSAFSLAWAALRSPARHSASTSFDATKWNLAAAARHLSRVTSWYAATTTSCDGRAESWRTTEVSMWAVGFIGAGRPVTTFRTACRPTSRGGIRHHIGSSAVTTKSGCCHVSGHCTWQSCSERDPISCYRADLSADQWVCPMDRTQSQ